MTTHNAGAFSEPSSSRSAPHAYIFDNAWQEQRRRLADLEALLDPGSIRHLEASGVGLGWKCLEVGAGGGSIVDWLCRRVGCSGRVVATDIDPRYIAALDHPNLEVRTHHLGIDELEAGVFDLVHTRLVLLHLSPDQRNIAVRQMLSALKPGGWLVVEDMDTMSLAPLMGTEDEQAHARKLFAAHDEVMRRRGADPQYGRRLLADLTAAGLDVLGAEGRVLIGRGGDAAAAVWRLTFEQIRPALIALGLATNEDQDALLRLLDDPSFAFQTQIFQAVWGCPDLSAS